MPLPEKALIARIRKAAKTRAPSVVAGIGDDAALLKIRPGYEVLVTTDFTLEGIHFRREWHAPQVVGRRCLTRGLSDIAAMGGEPVAAFLSLAVPRKLPQTWVDGFMKGLLELAKEFKVALAGGDTAESPAGVLADILVLGSVPRGKAILRSGAGPGDAIYVTGELGGGAAGLRELFAGSKLRSRDFARHFHPVPRIAVGKILRTRNLATAMIDLSDGLSTDLAHLCEESAVGAEILATQLPTAHTGRKRQPVDQDLVLHGGEDYELLFSAPQSVHLPPKIGGVRVTRIGQVMRNRRILLRNEDGSVERLEPKGWQHFASSGTREDTS